MAAAIASVALVSACWTAMGWALPPGRHYEMVSPPYKGGYGATGIEAAAPGGDSVAYPSLGAFAGAPANGVGFGRGVAYVATRGAYGWSTLPLILPATIAPYSAPPILDYSSTLEWSLFYGQPGADAGAAQFEDEEIEFLLHPTASPDPLGRFEVAGEVLKVPTGTIVDYVGGSRSLAHIVFEPLVGVALTPEAQGATASREIYDLATRGGGERPLRLVGVNNEAQPKPIDPTCVVDLGAGLGNGGKLSKLNALASDGEEIFFTTCAGSAASKQLFVRLGEERTLEVSRPLNPGLPFGGCGEEGNPGEIPGEVPCQGSATRPRAEFVSASEDGSKVFFLTTAALTSTDGDTSNDLYMAALGCPASKPECSVAEREAKSLAQASRAVGAEAADVQGVVAASQDGSHVYFVARGVLSGANAAGQSPTPQADNLYVYDSGSGQVSYIADLCSNALQSGEVKDIGCSEDLTGLVNDESLWATIEPEAQTTNDGRFLLFSSYGRLTADDADNARDVYRYDASTGSLERISVGEAGYQANGNHNDRSGESNADAEVVQLHVSEGHQATQAGMALRYISEDGSRIIFTSTEPLSPAATNGLLDAYEWHEGEVSLISTGSDEQPIGTPESVVMTPSGQDIFFSTPVRLRPQDTDEAPDLYDARLGPDVLHATPTRPEECTGDACQGPLTNPAPLLLPATVSQTAGENIGPPKASSKKKPSGKVKKKRHRRKRRRHAAKRASRRAIGGRR